MKKSLIISAFFAIIGFVGYVVAEQGDFSTLGFNTSGGYSYWRVDSSGYFVPGAASLYDIGTAVLPVRTIYAGTITGTGAVSGTTVTGSGIVQGAGVVSTAYMTPAQKTIAELNAITPTAKGQMYGCSDCVAFAFCTSTGTGRGAFSVITDTATHCL